MDDTKTLIITILRRMWRRRWLGICMAWVVCIGGWAVVANLPDTYQVTARVYVNTQTLLTPLLRGITVEPNIRDQVRVMNQTLLSGPNIAQVIRMADLDLDVKSEVEMEQLVTSTRQKIRVDARGIDLFSISYSHRDPKVAQRVVQSLLTIFVENNIGESRGEMETARAFLERQVLEYERQLQESEKRLADFRAANSRYLSKEGSYAAMANSVSSALEKARGELELAILSRDQIVNQLQSVPQYLEVDAAPQVVLQGRAVDPVVASLYERIRTIQSNLDSMQLKYTEQHPDVVAAKRTLETLHAQLAEEEKRVLAAGTGGEGGGRATQRIPNQLFEHLKLRLVDAEQAVAQTERRVMKVEEQLQEVQAIAAKAPEIETQMANLNRDYGIIKRNYEELLARRERAKMAQAVDTETEVQFRIVDPPKLPNLPSGPNREMLMSAVLMAGLGAGAGFLFLLLQLDTSFTSTNNLRQAFNLPVLGAVSMIVGQARIRMRRIELAGFAAACMVLFVAFATVLAIQPRLDLKALMSQVGHLL